MSPLNTFAILAAAYLTPFVESWPAGLRTWLGVQVDLLPVLMVYCALSTNLLTLTMAALVGGLCFDTLSNNPLGVTVLPLFLVGFVLYRSRDLILQDQTYAQIILGAAASAATPVLTFLLLWTAGFKPLIGWGSLWQWSVLIAGGAVLTPAWFWFFDRIQLALAYKRPAETSFRPDREIKRGRA
jgi:rod shape-determining protein MreD